MASAALKDFERASGGWIRADDKGFVFVPERRLGPWTLLALVASANLLAWLAELSDVLPEAFRKSGKEIPLVLLTLGCVTLLWIWGSWQVRLAWSHMARPDRRLSVRKVEETGYRERPMVMAEWGDVAIGPTSRRAFFEVTDNDSRLLVLVIGERAVCLSRVSTRSPWDGKSLVGVLIRTLDLTPERLGTEVDDCAITRAGASGYKLDLDEYREVRAVLVTILAFLASAVWVVPAGYFAFRNHEALLTHFSPVSGACVFALMFIGPPMAVFVAVARWVSAPVLNRTAADLVARTPE
jgi:hypothetical protein